MDHVLPYDPIGLDTIPWENAESVSWTIDAPLWEEEKIMIGCRAKWLSLRLSWKYVERISRSKCRSSGEFVVKRVNELFRQDVPRLVRVPIVALSFFVTGTLHAQNGKILSRTIVPVTNSLMQCVEPDLQSAIGLIDIQSITYLSDGLRVKGYLLTPRNRSNLPCVIYNRGGNGDFGALTDTLAVSSLARIASWGYVVVASQYRGNLGGDGHDEFGGRDVDDVLNLIPLLESLREADPWRIGMVGWSRGGLMTYLALTRTDRIGAAILGSSESDAFETLRSRPDMERVYSSLVPNYTNTKDAALTDRSPIRWVARINRNTPLLLLHGSADSRVDPTQALAMASALYSVHKTFRFVFFEGGDHGLTKDKPEVERLTKDWLDRYIRDRPSGGTIRSDK